MNSLFQDMIGNGVIVYIDDINVYATTFEGHQKLLQEVLERLRKAHLHIKPNKCSFAMRKMEFLGFILDHGNVKVDPKKTEIVRKFPIPKDKLTLRGFLSLVQFYKRFILGYSEIAVPLHMR